MIPLILMSLIQISNIDLEFSNPKCERISMYDHFVVVQKVDENIYEVRGMGGHMKGFIETNKTTFESGGVLRDDFMVKRLAIKPFQMENGFTDSYQMFRECTPKESK